MLVSGAHTLDIRIYIAYVGLEAVVIERNIKSTHRRHKGKTGGIVNGEFSGMAQATAKWYHLSLITSPPRQLRAETCYCYS